MTELKRAAAVLGKKGGKVKGPKGFAKSGKASDAGKKAMLNRWGKQVDITWRLIYLPRDEQAILEAGQREYDDPIDPADDDWKDYNAGDALGDLMNDAIMPVLERLGVYCFYRTRSADDPQTIELSRYFKRELRRVKKAQVSHEPA
jgi:hypothetical protein